jgi:hypothetical protein
VSNNEQIVSLIQLGDLFFEALQGYISNYVVENKLTFYF